MSEQDDRKLTASKNIAIGGISTECSSYSPLYQKESDFTSLDGQALLDLVDFPFNEYDLVAYPIFFNKSVPGGPIEGEYFEQIKDKFIEQLKQIDNLDGVLLLMHGAMLVDGIEDPEGEWIASVRKSSWYKTASFQSALICMAKLPTRLLKILTPLQHLGQRPILTSRIPIDDHL